MPPSDDFWSIFFHTFTTSSDFIQALWLLCFFGSVLVVCLTLSGIVRALIHRPSRKGPAQKPEDPHTPKNHPLVLPKNIREHQENFRPKTPKEPGARQPFFLRRKRKTSKDKPVPNSRHVSSKHSSIRAERRKTIF